MASAVDTPPRHAARRRVTGWDVSVLVAANAAVVVGLWWRQGGIREVADLAGLLTSLGRLTGLLGAFLALVGLAAARAHPRARRARRPSASGPGTGAPASAAWRCVLAHTALITAGYALADGVAARRGRPASC